MTAYVTIYTNSTLAAAVTKAIREGDLDTLKQLLDENPQLATARLRDDKDMLRSLLHIATDSPGHYPNGAKTISLLVESGADVHARFVGWHSETPLHWAASNDDVAAIDALLDSGADIEATGGVIGDGTPLMDARAFRQWNAAHRLVERGAMTTLVDAATLGLMDRVEDFFAHDDPPSGELLNSAFWGACHGGQLQCAKYLLNHGAELNWIPEWEELTPLDAAHQSEALEIVQWLRTQGARSAEELKS